MESFSANDYQKVPLKLPRPSVDFCAAEIGFTVRAKDSSHEGKTRIGILLKVEKRNFLGQYSPEYHLLEFPLYTGETTQNLALDAAVSASSTYGDGFSYTYYCNDENPATQWSGNDRNFVASDYYWLRLDFGTPATFSSVSLKAFRRQEGQETWLSWSSDGSTWTEIPGTRLTDGSSGGYSEEDYSFSTVIARYIQVNFNWPSAGAQPSIGEFEVHR